MVVVSDTSVIWYLFASDNLELLQKIYTEIVIPERVKQELLAAESIQLEQTLLNAEWIKVQTPSSLSFVKKYEGIIDDGELNAFALALEIKAGLVLVDDSDARKIARKLNLTFTGLVGIALEAEKRKLVPNAYDLLIAFRSKGFWISDTLLDKVKQ
jgi:predicted nucleic acid-binding protein